MKEQAIRVWLYHFITVLLAAVAVLLIWSSQAAWGRLDIGADRYKFGLIGIAHITNAATSRAQIESCGWFDAEPVPAYCRRAADGRTAYRLVRVAPVVGAFAEVAFVLAAFAHLRRGKQVSGTGLAPFALASALAITVAILLLTLNVARAVEVYWRHEVEMRGSGLTAAWLAVLLLLAAAAMSRFAPEQTADEEIAGAGASHA